MFHLKLNFNCTASGLTLNQVLSQTPANESVAIQITDVTNSKSYSYQAIHAMPFANVASQLVQMGAGNGEFLKWDSATKQWKPGTVSGASGGTVTSVSVSAPLSIATPTSTPSITLPQADSTTSGYLSAADWNAFNSKEGSFAAGTASQFYRGDKTWQTLDTSAVPENVNLYFTNARALGVPLTGFTAGAGTINATDTVLSAFGKTQGQIITLTNNSTHFLLKDSADTLSSNVALTGVITADPVLGDIVVRSVPMGMTSAVNKSYVDSEVGNKVSKAGDTVTGVLTLENDLKIKGGTNYVTVKGHASSANYNFVLPQNAGTSGYFLQTDGSGNLSWVAQSSTAAPTGAAGGDLAGTYPNPTVPGLAGKLSSTLTNGSIFVGNGSNVASGVVVSGDATLSNTGVLTLANTAVTAGTYKSVTVDGKGRVTGGTNPTTLAGYGITDTLVTGVSVTAPITNTGSATVPLLGMPAATGAVDGYLTSANFTTFINKQNAITSATNLAMGTLTSSEVRLNELPGNGTNYTGFKSPNALAADVIYTLPLADGTSGQVLSTNASGVLSWTSIPTSMAPNGAAGGGLSGTYPNPTIASGLDAAKLSSGAVTNTEFDYLDGVTSSIQSQLNNKQPIDPTLTSLAAYNTNGILVQIAADTFVGRSIVGTANRVNITDGNGVAGNPTINIDTGLLPSPSGSGSWLKSTGANTSAWTTLGSSDITSALGFTPINKASDTVSTGTFNFNGSAVLRTLDPVGPTDVVTKQYVDQYGQWSKNGSDIYRSSYVGIGISTPQANLHLQTGSDSTTGQTNCGVESATCPASSATGYGVIFDGSYNNGQYRTRFSQIDRGANLPLYVQQTLSTANVFKNIARFGTNQYDSNSFAVFGNQSATGNITSGGEITGKSYKTRLFQAGGKGAPSCTLSNANLTNLVDQFCDLAVSFTLTDAATVQINYTISMPTGSTGTGKHLVTGIEIDGTVVTTNITGAIDMVDSPYFGVSQSHFANLGVGAHSIKVKYRTPVGGINNPNNDWENRILQVMIMGYQ